MFARSGCTNIVTDSFLINETLSMYEYKEIKRGKSFPTLYEHSRSCQLFVAFGFQPKAS